MITPARERNFSKNRSQTGQDTNKIFIVLNTRAGKRVVRYKKSKNNIGAEYV
jgi:hypothetical protein